MILAANTSCTGFGARLTSAAPVLPRHVVIVLVDRLDLATVRALPYARTLTPDELRGAAPGLRHRLGRAAARPQRHPGWLAPRAAT